MATPTTPPPPTSMPAPTTLAEQLGPKPSWWTSFMHSGSRKHVALGVFVVGGLMTLPWVLMTSGKKSVSHQDYQELAEKARRARLSTS